VKKLFCSAVAAALCWPTMSAANNVVFLIADDIGVDKIAAYGESPTAGPTPNIDALAAQGVSFRNAWAYPVCSPSRASMLTGLHPTRHGVGWYTSPQDPRFSTGLDPTQQTLPKLLEAAGIRSEAFGKWHAAGIGPFLNVHPNLTGFSHFSGFLWGGVSYFLWPKTVDGSTAYTTKYATTDTADDVIAALGGSQPFFLWVGFLASHLPYEDPPASLHSVDLTGTPLAGNEILYHQEITESMDSEIGRILAAVDFSTTTVIFIGDNGTNNDVIEPPFRAGRGKFTVYEGGLNVPLIVAGQAVAVGSRGQMSEALVQGTDLFATILDIAGVGGSTADSRSFAPYLSDPMAPSSRKVVYSEGFFPNGGPIDPTKHWRAARDARYKIVRNGVALDEFYDLAADPFEYVNLRGTPLAPEQQTAYDRLDSAIRAVAAPSCLGDCTGDGVVGATDFARLRQEFGNDCILNPGLTCSCDSNGDGRVGATEFASLRANFGLVCSP